MSSTIIFSKIPSIQNDNLIIINSIKKICILITLFNISTLYKFYSNIFLHQYYLPFHSSHFWSKSLQLLSLTFSQIIIKQSSLVVKLFVQIYILFLVNWSKVCLYISKMRIIRLSFIIYASNLQVHLFWRIFIQN